MFPGIIELEPRTGFFKVGGMAQQWVTASFKNDNYIKYRDKEHKLNEFIEICVCMWELVGKAGKKQVSLVQDEEKRKIYFFTAINCPIL